ncbi:MAG TPA: ABC transporter permease [Bryobacteraceae bacterium]|jgi:putative ABC transport system permease protein
MKLVEDLRYAWRTLRRTPGYTITAIVALALGIGANTAIFSVFNALLLRSLPYRDPQSLVMLWEDLSQMGFPRNTPSAGSYNDWATKIPAFDGVAAADTYDVNLTGEGEPENVGAAAVTGNTFTVFGVGAYAGRVFTPDEDRPGANRVVVLSYRLWQRRFGGERSIVGTEINLNGANHKVIGVMPPRFQFPFKDCELWTPRAFTSQDLANRGNHYLWVAARLKSGATLAQANAQLRALAEQLHREFPRSQGMGMYAVSILDDFLGDTRLALNVLFAAVAGVLLIACANMANLALARASGRKREIAVRTALGARRGRIIRQLVTEHVLLSLAGGAFGLLLARWGFTVLKNLVPEQLSNITAVSLDPRVLVFTLLVSIATGVLFGIAPAWQVSRTDLNVALKEGGARGSVGGRAGTVRGALVIGQIAAAMVLVIGAALMIESFARLRGLDPGFRSDGVLTARTVLPRNKYSEPARRTQYVDQVLERVRRIPGVESAGFTSALPLVWKGGSTGFWPEGRARDAADPRPYDANNRVISPGYMETMGYKLLAGRFLDARDGAEAPPAAMINDTMARQYWPNENALGRRFRYSNSPRAKGPWITIVGIVGDVHAMGLDQPARPEMFYPVAQAGGNWMWPRDLAVRTRGNPVQVAAAIRQAVWSVDKDQPVSKVETMDEILGDETIERRTQTALLGGFAGLALLLACLGIYAVLSYLVAQRTREIGLRMALGARQGDVLRWIGGQAAALALAGIAAGLGMAYWATLLLRKLLFHVEARDPSTFVSLAVVVMVVSLAAVSIPARRAARVDPMVALRHE